jgi:guanosine-3',5'-bis(diphosphate) 3'-pyrophosphohydrolase
LLLPAVLQGLGRIAFAPRPRRSPKPPSMRCSDKLGYLSKAEVKQVREAYKFADRRTWASSAPAASPTSPTRSRWPAWWPTGSSTPQALMAALMHDAMEDCGITKPELIEKFGAPTADLVDGLTKLDKLQFSTREEGQAESFRKMLLAMARDVRVILIKLADRLHNMRTMTAMPPNKRGASRARRWTSTRPSPTGWA